MVKFSVTEELATLIRTLRTQGKISSKEMASHLHRSPSYVSKLENGSVKTIQEPLLTSILSYLVDGDDFYTDKLPVIMKTLSSFIEQGRMARQIWLLHYDNIERPISVPTALSADISERMEKLGMSVDDLATLVNSNADSPLSAQYPANEFLDYALHGRRILLSRAEVKAEDISRMLEEQEYTANYFFLENIVYVLTRREHYGEDELSADQGEEVLRECGSYLSRFGVNSLTEYNLLLLSESNFLDGERSLKPMISSSSSRSLNEVVACLEEASSHDIAGAASALDVFSRNLSWDTAFMLKLVEQPFYQFDSASFSVKQKLLDDIERILEKYSAMPEYEKSMERYE